MPDGPHAYHPVNADGDLDTTVTVEMYQHTALNTTDVAAWCGGEVALVNGGNVVIVGGTRRAVDRLCGLGDYAVRDGDRWWAEPVDGLYQRYRPVGSD